MSSKAESLFHYESPRIRICHALPYRTENGICDKRPAIPRPLVITRRRFCLNGADGGAPSSGYGEKIVKILTHSVVAMGIEILKKKSRCAGCPTLGSLINQNVINRSR